MKASSLGTQLRHLIEMLDGDVQQAYADAGLVYRPRYTPIMRQLMQREPLTVGEIVAGARVTQAAVTQTVALMVKDGIVRVASSAKDGRQRLISLTGRGRRMIPKLEECWNATAMAHADLEADIGSSLTDTLERAINALKRKSYAARINEARTTLQTGKGVHP